MDASENSPIQDADGIFPEPYVGMEFDSENAAKTFYKDYARHVGFDTRIQSDRSKSNGKATCRGFSCSRNKIRKKSGESCCEAMLRIELRSESKWVVTKFVKDHSHAILNCTKLHCLRPKLHVSENFQGIDVVPSGVMYVSVDENSVPGPARLNFTPPDFSSPKRTLGRDAHNLLEYFKKMQAENLGFCYAIQLDEENRMTNAFWADSRSRTAYGNFGDAVVFDTSYREKQYRVPFAPFTGFNHHGQIILFGCALLLDETEATFIWLFTTFLAAMNGHRPVSFTTDKDIAIKSAVIRVFPETRHCVNKWHVLGEGREIMARLCSSHPDFQTELSNCVNTTETVEEFESYWESIVQKYDLKSNDWLRSIYEARSQWVPVYFRDSFFASFSDTGFNGSFFDGYVNQHTTLPMFFRQYERALENSLEREIEADYDTMRTTPVLRTPSPMEKQAADLYTKKIFSKFQEELVETFAYTANRVVQDGRNSTFRVAKFEQDEKAYIVLLNIAEMKANCSCRMFEYSGILCRHVLTVFTVTNLLTLPNHYVLNRWTRNAKSVDLANDHSESLTIRFNNLCKEAIRFAEEGAVTDETYNAAVVSLREGAKKVAGVRKSGAGYDERRTSIANPEMTPLLWPRQDEIIRPFNLNIVGFPSQLNRDSNVPCMRPVSINRKGGRTGNMSFLPCLKSMTWVMENKNSTADNRVAVINLKLHDYGKTPTGESEVIFSLSRVTLEPMLRSMATHASKVAVFGVINLKGRDWFFVERDIESSSGTHYCVVQMYNRTARCTTTRLYIMQSHLLQDRGATSGQSEVRFQVSRDTLGAMLRSMSYIREQLSNAVEPTQDNPAKRSCT